MDGKFRLIAIVVAVGIATIVAWNLSQPSATGVAPAADTNSPQAAVTVPEAEWFEQTTAPAAGAENAAADSAAVEPAPPEPVEAPPAAPQPLSAESLKDTRWKEGDVDVMFMADGRWSMNGRICAHWIVERDRVKIFDDKGEIHYVDIEGDRLVFNGKKIGRVGAGG